MGTAGGESEVREGCTVINGVGGQVILILITVPEGAAFVGRREGLKRDVREIVGWRLVDEREQLSKCE